VPSQIVWNGSVLLDGVNDWFTANEQDNPIPAAAELFSISGWVKGPAQEDGIVASQWSSGALGSWALKKGRAAVNGTDKLTLWIVGTTSGSLYRAQGNVTVFDNTWHHIAATWSNGTNAKLYVDGVEDLGIVFLGTIPDTVKNSSASFFIGKDAAGVYNPYQGNMAMLNFWDTAILSAADVTALATGVGVNPTTLVSAANLTHSYQPGISSAIILGASQYDLVDQSGNGDTTQVGVSLGTADFVVDYPGIPLVTDTKSIIFDGVDETISFGDVLKKSNTSVWSQSIWVKSGADSQVSKCIWSKQEGVGSFAGWNLLTTGVNDLLSFVINDASPPGENFIHYTVSNMFTLNTWVHMVITYDGSSTAAGIKVYKNGGLQSKSVVRDDLAGTIDVTAAMRLGSRFDTPSSFWNGRSTSAAIFDKELSQAEVLALYNSGVVLDPRTNLAANTEFFPPLGEAPDDVEVSNGVVDKIAGNNGTAENMTNAANIVADVPSYTLQSCWNFGGTDEYIKVLDNASLDISDNFSFESIIKLSSAPAGPNLFIASKRPAGTPIAYQFYIENTTGFFIVYVADGANDKQYIHQTNMADGAAHQLGMTFEAGVLKIFVDGADVTAGASKPIDDAMTVISTNNDNVNIGSFGDGSGAFFVGKLGRVLFWDTEVLTAAEFAELWNSGTPTNPTSNHGAYTSKDDFAMALLMESGDTISANGVLDSSGNGNHGSTQAMEAGDLQAF